MRGVAIIEPALVKTALEYLGSPTEPPAVASARDPPYADDIMDQRPLFETTAPSPTAGFEFDQRVSR